MLAAVEQLPRRFTLHRRYDVTGVSGTGVIAFGTLYPSGRVTGVVLLGRPLGERLRRRIRGRAGSWPRRTHRHSLDRSSLIAAALILNKTGERS